VHQGKYTKDMLKKFDMGMAKPLSMPMSTMMALDTDEEGEVVDQKEYHSMIGSLLYLTATRLDIQFVVGLCVRFQSSSHTSHRQAVKRIMRYLHSHLSLVFGFRSPPLFLFTGILIRIMLVIALRESPHRGLVNLLDLLLCLGPLASSPALPNPPQKLNMLLPLLAAPNCFG
jgi:hypothetical protein